MPRSRAALAALALLALSGAARADVAAGEWQITTSVAVPGMPGALGPFSQTQCLSAAEAKNPTRLFGTPGGGCAFTNERDDGRRFSFELSCSGPTKVSGSGSVRYAADAFDGELEMHSDFGGQMLTVRSRIAARRVGPCAQ